MRALAPLALVLLLTIAAAAEESTGGEDVLSGRYVGRGYVYDATGALAKSDLRMDIRTGDGEVLRVELAYFHDAVARFTNARADGPFRVAIDEAVGSDAGTPARARGQIVSFDGRRAAGTIEVYASDTPDAPRLRRITFLVDKLAEKPAK